MIKNNTKQKILDYAIDLFKRKGYGSTSIEDLRLETGISKGLMYYHFKNKEELFVSCLKYDTLQHLDSWEKIHRSQASATEKLIMIADYLTEEDQSSLSFSIPQFIEESSKRSAEQRFTLKELNEEIIIPEINVFNTIIEDGINTGEFDDELDVSEVSIMLYSSLTSMSLMNHYLPDDTDIKSVVNNFMNRMITTMKT